LEESSAWESNFVTVKNKFKPHRRHRSCVSECLECTGQAPETMFDELDLPLKEEYLYTHHAQIHGQINGHEHLQDPIS